MSTPWVKKIKHYTLTVLFIYSITHQSTVANDKHPDAFHDIVLLWWWRHPVQLEFTAERLRYGCRGRLCSFYKIKAWQNKTTFRSQRISSLVRWGWFLPPSSLSWKTEPVKEKRGTDYQKWQISYFSVHEVQNPAMGKVLQSCTWLKVEMSYSKMTWLQVKSTH